MAEPLVRRIEDPEETALATLASLQGDEIASTDEKIDRLELAMVGMGVLIDLETDHVFTPGLVSRTIYMPAGTLLTSRIHKHKHQYAVLAGDCSVFIDGVGVERIRAPFCGVTESGTRRVLYIHEDTIWTTFHPSNAQTVEEFEAEEFEDRPLLGDMSSHQLHLSITSEMRQMLEAGGVY